MSHPGLGLVLVHPGLGLVLVHPGLGIVLEMLCGLGLVTLILGLAKWPQMILINVPGKLTLSIFDGSTAAIITRDLFSHLVALHDRATVVSKSFLTLQRKALCG